MTQLESFSGHMPEPATARQLEEAFEAFNKVSVALDSSYKYLENKVAALTDELAAARSARLRELAEKERLANRLSALISALPGGVLLLDADDQVREANPEAEELLGQPLQGQRWEKVLDRVETGQTGEISGSTGKKLSLMSRPLGGDGDKVMLLTDVTEIHQLQEQVSQKKRLSALGEMAARMAHQVRTPLSSSLLYLSQLSRADLSERDRKRISLKVHDRLNHMERLVSSMLSFVRGGDYHLESLAVSDIFRQLENTVSPQVSRAGVTLVIARPDAPLSVIGSRDALVDALSNLVMNALEAASGDIEVSVAAQGVDGQRLQISVSDTGPGIEEQLLERIFDPFFTTRVQGTGLGLAVVAMTIRAHEGSISVANRPAGGARFVITLPMAAAEEPCEGATE